MLLYYYPNACSLAPHILLHELGRDFTLIKVDLAKRSTEQGQDYLDINPKGQVPVLRLDNDEVLTEVSVILEYIARLDKSNTLLPGSDDLEYFRTREWLSFLSAELHKAGFAPLFRAATPVEYQEIAKGHIKRSLDHIDRALLRSSYLAGDRMSIADILAYVMLRWAKRKDVSLEPWPRVQEFVARIAERDAVKSALTSEGLA